MMTSRGCILPLPARTRGLGGGLKPPASPPRLAALAALPALAAFAALPALHCTMRTAVVMVTMEGLLVYLAV